MAHGSGFDVVIVGGRCSGAALATLLARAGLAVTVVEKDSLHTDQVLSTHTIHPAALDVLDEIGVGDAVRAVAPPSRTLRIGKNDAFVDIRFKDGRAEYCPRRKRLDGLIQDAAAAAGAEFRERTRVTALLRRGGRVVGVRTTDRFGRNDEIRANLVVGADGRHSTVARLVEAEEYLGYDAPRALYWGYWNAPPTWRDYPFEFFVGNRYGSIRAVFQTDHGQLPIGSAPPVSEVAERYFFRQSTGPGWVLVGDAGHHKEFVIGDGITEALLQVRSLATAILGSPGLLLNFLAMGKRGAAVAREMKTRRALLAQAMAIH